MPWDFMARALFVGAGIFAVWAIVHTTREAWPHIKAILMADHKELDQ